MEHDPGSDDGDEGNGDPNSPAIMVYFDTCEPPDYQPPQHDGEQEHQEEQHDEEQIQSEEEPQLWFEEQKPKLVNRPAQKARRGRKRKGPVAVPSRSAVDSAADAGLVFVPNVAAGKVEEEQKKRRSREWWQRLKHDPERYERFKAQSRESMRRLYARRKAAKAKAKQK